MQAKMLHLYTSWIPGVGLKGEKHFLKMAMLHIKLKGVKCRTNASIKFDLLDTLTSEIL